jgi:serine/threonine protein kinase
LISIYLPRFEGMSPILNCRHRRIIKFLQPENILLYNPGPYPRIQIADFGLAREKSYQETFNVCGTVAYLPPEGECGVSYPVLYPNHIYGRCTCVGA